MPQFLEDIELDEISLVDQGANQHAHIVMVKRFDGEDSHESFEESEADAPETVVEKEEDVMSDDLTKRVGELEAEIADLKKANEELEATVAEKAAEVEALKADDTEAEVEKSADDELPEEVAKRVEEIEKRAAEAEAEIAKMRDEKAIAEWIAKAGDKAGPMLKRVAGVDADLADEIHTVIKALEEQVEKGALFEEVGKNGGDGASAADKLEKKAEEIQKAEGCTIEKARALAADRNRDLVADIRNGK